MIDGRCGPYFRGEQTPALAERTLWIFPPECSHGWAAEGEVIRRVALHFSTVPHPLDVIVRERGWFTRKLTTADIQRMTAIATELQPHFDHPSLLSQLCFQGRLMDLAALALAGQPDVSPTTLTDLATSKVERAIDWFTEHLSRNPSIREVANSVHVSPSHLRRLFWQVRKTSPKTAFQRIRLDRANELMGQSTQTLETVARHCGYCSASHFCREYKNVNKFTPTHWRKQLTASGVSAIAADPPVEAEFSPRDVDSMVCV